MNTQCIRNHTLKFSDYTYTYIYIIDNHFIEKSATLISHGGSNNLWNRIMATIIRVKKLAKSYLNY